MSTMKTLLAASILLAGTATGAVAQGEHDHGEATPLLHKDWPHAGVFGKFDKAAAQRGFQIYREVCSACHALHYVAFRDLEDLGFSEDEVSALAAEYEVEDGPDDNGEMFLRPGKASDRLPSPHANENAARAANGGAYPPDLSLITKARADGTNYVYSLLQGYSDEPPVEVAEGMNYNAYFPGHQIAMPKPLADGQVEYTDGSPTTVAQYATDVSAFLMWAAEPHLEARKQLGLRVLIYLAITAFLLWLTKRMLWSRIGH